MALQKTSLLSFYALEVIREGEDLELIGNDIINFATFFMKVLKLFKMGRVGYGNTIYIDPKIETLEDYQKYYQLHIIDLGVSCPVVSLIHNINSKQMR